MFSPLFACRPIDCNWDPFRTNCQFLCQSVCFSLYAVAVVVLAAKSALLGERAGQDFFRSTLTNKSCYEVKGITNQKKEQEVIDTARAIAPRGTKKLALEQNRRGFHFSLAGCITVFLLTPLLLPLSSNDRAKYLAAAAISHTIGLGLLFAAERACCN